MPLFCNLAKENTPPHRRSFSLSKKFGYSPLFFSRLKQKGKNPLVFTLLSACGRVYPLVLLALRAGEP